MIARLIALLLLWYALTGGESWGFGVAAAVAAAAVASLVRAGWSGAVLSLSVGGLLRFLLHFLYRSVAGGIDIAWRALHPRMPLAVRERQRVLDLPSVASRALFVAVVSLLPGTLACQYVGKTIRIHSISEDTDPDLDQLEMRVREVFAPYPGNRG